MAMRKKRIVSNEFKFRASMVTTITEMTMIVTYEEYEGVHENAPY